MPIRLVQTLAMLVCLSLAIFIKWIWPYEGSLLPSPPALLTTPAPPIATNTSTLPASLDHTADSNLVFRPQLFVSPIGDDQRGDGTLVQPWHSIQQAMQQALPGSTIYLADGHYDQDIITVRNGTLDQPIRLMGSAQAVVNGGGNMYVVDIQHNYIELEGFTIDGLWETTVDAESRPEAYRRKLIYAHSPLPLNGITGLRVMSMTLQNAGDECLRMKYFATQNEVAYSSFKSCGQLDFRFGGLGKNGENIYIGTAPNQLNRNPTPDSDESSHNWIHHNTFVSNGNECVDIKEGSSRNLIEYNDCASQQDSASGGFNVRGNDNTFRFNRIFGNRGAGVRLGGETDADGVGNHVYYNELIDNAAGGVKFQQALQGIICGNRASAKPSAGAFATNFTPEAPCPPSVPRPVGLMGRTGGGVAVETLVRSDEALSMQTEQVESHPPSIVKSVGDFVDQYLNIWHKRPRSLP